MRGNITIGTAIAGALTGLGIIGSIFGWTYNQFSSVQAHASESDQRIAKVEEAISTLKDTTTETRNDVKEVLRNIKR
jgi:hypothetical protein